jgi:hypothetical protein
VREVRTRHLADAGRTAMLHALVAEATQSGQESSNLLPVLTYAIIAFCALMGMLMVTWAFKSVGTRH